MTIIGPDGRETSARVAGKVYHDMSPVTGDRAVAVMVDGIPVVEEILPRESVLQRTSPLGRTTQVIAANIDRVLAVCSLRQPDLSHGFLCRALAASEWMGLGSAIVLNKMDLCRTPEDLALLEEVNAVYGCAGYSVFGTSTIDGGGTEELLDHIRGLTVVMTGPSGSGKTSMVKSFVPSLQVRIGEVNPHTLKGRHTTVAARMIPLPGGTFLIDTPGLRMFSIDHIPAEEIQNCFPEFREFLGNCRFVDCLHLSEPGCAVKGAVERGDIHPIRYGIYEGFMEEAGGRS